VADRWLRKGLGQFHAGLFLDPRLTGVTASALGPLIDHLSTHGGELPRLRGVHALLTAPEVTLVAVPDAGHRGWGEVRFAEVAPSRAAPEPTAPPVFVDCAARALEAPALSVERDPVRSDHYIVRLAPRPATTFIVVEASQADFADAVVLANGSVTAIERHDQPPGAWYYRARAHRDGLDGPWSAPVSVAVEGPARRQMVAPAAYDPGGLLAVHRALLRMCAACGELFAVLSLPAHFDERQAAAYAERLRAGPHPAAIDAVPVPFGAEPVSSLPLSAGEQRALSHGALYHPWVVGRPAGPGDLIARLPPDGALLGTMAALALRDGAWRAPANRPLQGPFGLVRSLPEAAWPALQRARVNVVRAEPRGFLCLSADTLSDEPDWGHIGVRRLFCALRRAARQHGEAYVFEPNHEAFARLVYRVFFGLLERLHQRGAFAGRLPAEGFQVVVNTRPADRDAGRLIVELRIAPSVPLRFLTVRLVQSQDGLVLEEA
ncbi:MAG: phage tail sheath family protein, partial [Myxococcales bacterium]|nr:phage tail sheath family protein [Myxococcales bacterium]